jgi:hypothetical protein
MRRCALGMYSSDYDLISDLVLGMTRETFSWYLGCGALRASALRGLGSQDCCAHDECTWPTVCVHFVTDQLSNMEQMKQKLFPKVKYAKRVTLYMLLPSPEVS